MAQLVTLFCAFLKQDKKWSKVYVTLLFYFSLELIFMIRWKKIINEKARAIAVVAGRACLGVWECRWGVTALGLGRSL